MTYFNNAILIFDERQNEMITFLENCIGLKNRSPSIIDRETEHILKSNIVLMQYNILESSFLELYKSLYDFLKTCNISVDYLNKSFTYNIYSIIKRSTQIKHTRVQTQLTTTNTNFSKCAMSICFELDDEEKKFLVNGNLDGKKIKDFLQDFGIDITELNSLNLSNIRTLKDNRQLLAHGGSSFSDVGEGVSWDTLELNVATLSELFHTSLRLLQSFCESMTPETTTLAS